eukprot:g34826.t1
MMVVFLKEVETSACRREKLKMLVKMLADVQGACEIKGQFVNLHPQPYKEVLEGAGEREQLLHRVIFVTICAAAILHYNELGISQYLNEDFGLHRSSVCVESADAVGYVVDLL